MSSSLIPVPLLIAKEGQHVWKLDIVQYICVHWENQENFVMKVRSRSSHN